MGIQRVSRYLPLGLLGFLLLSRVAVPQARAADFSDDFAGPLKADWTVASIGNLGQGEFTGKDIKTTATAEGGLLTVISGGGNAYDQKETDDFGYVYLKPAGDWQATLKVTRVGERRVRAGIVARASTDPGSPSVFFATQRLGGLIFGSRAAAGEVPAVSRNLVELDTKTPVWLRLVRRGRLFQASRSYDGENWVAEPGALVNPAFDTGDALVGIGVSSQIEDSYGLAQFGGFSLTAPPAVESGLVTTTALLTDADGNPVSGAWVSVRDAGNNQVGGGRTMADGRAVLPLLKPGSYTLVTLLSGYEPLLTSSAAIQSGTEITLTGLKANTSLDLTPLSWQLKVPALITDDLSAPGVSTEGFQPATVPGNWGDQGFPADNNTYGWYRLAVTLPDALQGKNLLLSGFTADDSDWTYWDGHLIGSRQQDTGTVRSYGIPSPWTAGASHTLAVRVYNVKGGAGITGGTVQLRLLANKGAITGLVTDASGTPAALTPVRLIPSWPSMEPLDWVATTGADGVYGFAGLDTGRYRVVLDRVPAAPAKEVTLEDVGLAQTADFPKQGAPTVELIQENGFNWKLKATRPYTVDELGDLANIMKNDVGDYSATNADESAFQPFELSGKNLGYQATTDGDAMWAWFRLHLTPPKAWSTGQRGDLRLWGWQMEDADHTYFNGHEIGQSGSSVEEPLSFIDAYNAFRDYLIPAAYVNWDGDNVLAIRDLVGGNAVGWGRGTLPLLSATAASAGAAPLLGDVNANGKLDITDVVMLLRSVAGLATLDATQTTAGDFNQDGKISIADVVAVLRKVAGL